MSTPLHYGIMNCFRWPGARVMPGHGRELISSGIKACPAIYGKIASCFPSLFLTEAMKSNLVFCRSLLMSTPFQNGIMHCFRWPGARVMPEHARELISSGINLSRAGTKGHTVTTAIALDNQ